MTKHVTPNQLSASNSAIGEPSFADVLQAIAMDPSLGIDRQRHWATSLRKMAEYLDRPLSLIPARISGINRQITALHPARLGVKDKTFANHRANARAALNWFKDRKGGLGRAAAMSDAYRNFLTMIDNRHHRDVMSPFFRYLSMVGISPADICDDHLAGYVQYCSETKFRPPLNASIRSLTRHFNDYAGSIPDWPNILLAIPATKMDNTLSWDRLPPGLRSDIDAALQRRARPRKSASGRRMRGCKRSTLNLMKRKLEAAVRMAVRAGIALDELSSLSALLHPDHSEVIIDAYWQADGDEPGSYTIALSSMFLDLARSDTQLHSEAMTRLEDMRANLQEYRKSGLTDKNMALIRQVLATDTGRG